MHRDPNIQRVFETADDSLHGIIGYHMYVAAMQNAVDREKMLQFLPEGSFQTTFSWVRYYQKQDLIGTFEQPILELYQSKILLVALTSVFEAVLDDFIQHLQEKGFLKVLPHDNYKARIEWAYEQALKAKIGEKATIKRLPKTCGIIDNARRLRNLFVHNHGLFDEKYERFAIRKRGMVVDLHPFYEEFRKNPQKKIPVVLDWNYPSKIYFSPHRSATHIAQSNSKGIFRRLRRLQLCERGKANCLGKITMGKDECTPNCEKATEVPKYATRFPCARRQIGKEITELCLYLPDFPIWNMIITKILQRKKLM